MPNKIVDLFRLGEGTPPTLGVGTGEVVDGFYSFLGFTRLMTSGVIRKAISRGVQEGPLRLCLRPETGALHRRQVRGRTQQGPVQGCRRRRRDRPRLRIPDDAASDPPNRLLRRLQGRDRERRQRSRPAEVSEESSRLQESYPLDRLSLRPSRGWKRPSNSASPPTGTACSQPGTRWPTLPT